MNQIENNPRYRAEAGFSSRFKLLNMSNTESILKIWQRQNEQYLNDCQSTQADLYLNLIAKADLDSNMDRLGYDLSDDNLYYLLKDSSGQDSCILELDLVKHPNGCNKKIIITEVYENPAALILNRLERKKIWHSNIQVIKKIASILQFTKISIDLNNKREKFFFTCGGFKVLNHKKPYNMTFTITPFRWDFRR